MFIIYLNFVKTVTTYSINLLRSVLVQGQIQEQLAQQKAQENKVSSFIKACRVMEQRVTMDIETLKGHWEKYGYQAPRDAQGPTSK